MASVLSDIPHAKEQAAAEKLPYVGHLAVCFPDDAVEIIPNPHFETLLGSHAIGRVTFFVPGSGHTKLKDHFNNLFYPSDSKEEISLPKVFNEVVAGRLRSGTRVRVLAGYDARKHLAAITGAEALNGTETLSEDRISELMEADGFTDPDLVIFTGGRNSPSEALVWNGAYSEFAFCSEPWHQLGEAALQEILAGFGKRDRRFGGVSEA